MNLLDQMSIRLPALRELRTSYPEVFPFPFFFEPGRLLLRAVSDDGDLFCWNTVGASGVWDVVTVPRSASPEHFKTAPH